jgi:recombinational DNA repair ATPase RecF
MTAEAQSIQSPFEFSMRYESTLMPPEGATAEEVQQRFQVRLVSSASEEMRRGVTLTGPHRDDIQLCLGTNDLRRYGSQGQRRLFAVLLKLAELAHIESELREACVLLWTMCSRSSIAAIMSRLQHLFEGHRQVFVTTPVELPQSSIGAHARAARARWSVYTPVNDLYSSVMRCGKAICGHAPRASKTNKKGF